MAATRFRAIFSPPILDKNPPHRFGCRAKEMPSAVPVLRLLAIDESQVRFVNERGGLQSLSWLFLGDALSSQAAQFIVDERQQLLGGGGIARFYSRQDLSNVVHDGSIIPQREVREERRLQSHVRHYRMSSSEATAA